MLCVEVVKADNPYGCNQHAHSWVGQCPYDAPPEGQEWKPPVRKKDKKQDEKQDEKQEKKQEKKEKRDKPASGEFVYSRLSELFGEDVAKKFEGALQKAPEWVRGFYERHIQEALKKIETTNGTSCHQAGHVYINKSSIRNCDYGRRELDVLFHEIAHALDYKIGKDRDALFFHPSTELHKLIDEDYREHVDKYNNEELERAYAVIKENPNATVRELMDAAYKNGDIGQWAYDSYKDSEKEWALPIAYQKALGKRRTGKGRLTMTMSNGTSGLERHVKSLDPRVGWIVCDAFRYKHGYDTGCGHGKSYYNNWGKNADAMETFSQLYVAYAENDEKIISEVEKLLPRTCKRFKEMVKEM